MNRSGSVLHTQATQALEALDRFYGTPLNTALERCLTLDPGQQALDVFHTAAQRVPALSPLLGGFHGIESEQVRTLADFRQLPVTTKETYHRPNALADLCLDGHLAGCDMLAVSSGSTDSPPFGRRFVADELGSAERFEQVLVDTFGADRKRTLAVVCFALGTWVGGMYTTACCRHVAAKGHPITVVTPGNQKPEILRVLRSLAPLPFVYVFGRSNLPSRSTVRTCIRRTLRQLWNNEPSPRRSRASSSSR